jgi:hypothetical protein
MYDDEEDQDPELTARERALEVIACGDAWLAALETHPTGVDEGADEAVDYARRRYEACACLYGEDVARDFLRAFDDLDVAHAELADFDVAFALRFDADASAAERWRAAHPERPFAFPDHADLVTHLLGEIARLDVDLRLARGRVEQPPATAKLPKFAVGDVVESHGEEGRVVDVRYDAFSEQYRVRIRRADGNGFIGSLDSSSALRLISRKVYPGCVTFTCPECAGVWPVVPGDELHEAVVANVRAERDVALARKKELEFQLAGHAVAFAEFVNECNDVSAQARADERERIAAQLDARGFEPLAARIRAGESP